MRRIFIAATLLMLVCGMAQAGDAVEPASTNVISKREDSGSSLVTSTPYYKASTLLLTNNYTFTAGGSVTQGLDAVVVDINIGNTSSNVAYTGNVYAVASVTNRWWQSITIPDITGTIQIQVKLTDENTNIYIYPAQNFTVRDSL